MAAAGDLMVAEQTIAAGVAVVAWTATQKASMSREVVPVMVKRDTQVVW